MNGQVFDGTLFTYPASVVPAGVSLTVADFVETEVKLIVRQLRQFVKNVSGRRASAAEVASWNDGIPRLQMLLNDPRLLHLLILLEVKIPLSLERIDCLLVGSGPQSNNRVIVIELKAWSNAVRLPPPSTMLLPVLPSGKVLDEPKVNPSVQASRYRSQLIEMLVACRNEADVSVSAVAWVYNAKSDAPFNDAAFDNPLIPVPVFCSSEADQLRAHLATLVPNTPESSFLQRLSTSLIEPSRTLIERFARSIATEPPHNLRCEQIEALNHIVGEYTTSERRVVIVNRGAETSAIAVQLLRAFHKNNIPAVYTAGSGHTVRYLTGTFSDAKGLFSHFSHLGAEQVPVLIVDQAHRLNNLAQMRLCIESAQLSVFFIDDKQIIVPSDVTGWKKIRDAAVTAGVKHPRVLDLVGHTQCGADLYAAWVDGVFRLAAPKPASYSPAYHFEIVDSPHDLKARMRESGNSWRVVAGYCWPWSDPTESGELVPDVSIPEYAFQQSWIGNTKKLSEGSLQYHAAQFWATDPRATDLVGHIYAAQGFDFDYVGVIFGSDLVIRNGQWRAVLNEHSQSDQRFFLDGTAYHISSRATLCLRNVYRTLLTRGRKGCYVFFQDPGTRAYFESELRR